MAAETQTLVLLVGPPAVGKMTVGQELSARLGLPLFHNHLSIEAVLPVFPFGHPAFNRLVTMLRREVMVEVAGSDLAGLIFTFVWAFNEPGELDYVRELASLFEKPHLFLDNSRLTPQEAAESIIAHFELAQAR